VSTDDVLDLPDGTIESAELWEISESSDPLRAASWADALRGGRLGVSCSEFLRVGKGGGPLLLGRGGEGLSMSRSIGGGGRMPLDLALAGSLLACFVTDDPKLGIGGLLIVLLLELSCGRGTSDVGGGGGGRFLACEAPLLRLSLA
jgi:hypothetical protein